MNAKVRSSFEAVARLSRGTRCNKSELDHARDRLRSSVPDWYWEALSQFPIAGGCFTYETTGQRHDFDWFRPADMLDEAYSVQPGMYVRESGLVPIAGCATGSGDPYFIRFDSEDPAVIQVFHDAAAPSGMAPGGFRVVARSLSELLSNMRAYS